MPFGDIYKFLTIVLPLYLMRRGEKEGQLYMRGKV